MGKNKITIAIDCHKLEGNSENNKAGVGRNVYKLIEEISKMPELEKEFRFYLYFKGEIPKIKFLNNPIFVKKIVKLPLFFPTFKPSYNIYFHIALPFYCLKDRVNATFFSSFMLPFLFIGKSIANITNDVFYEYKNGTLPLKYRVSYMLFANWAVIRATILTTFTQSAKEDISKYINASKKRIDVIPLGVDVEKIKMPGGAPLKKNYILYVGQAFPRRHLKETILAFEQIAPEFPNLKLIAIGTDKYNPPIIKELIRETNSKISGRILHKNSVSDDELFELYREAKLLIYVSSSEAFGLPPVEVLAAQTAPVVADNNLTHEIFGDNALFVKNPNDPKSIADVIKRGLTNHDLVEKIILNRNEVLSKYTWKKYTDKMLDLFREMA